MENVSGVSERVGVLPEQEFRVFVRKARQAAHQALFFLYELECLERLPDDDDLRRNPRMVEEVRYAVDQVGVIVNGVAVLSGNVDPDDVPRAEPIEPGLRSFFLERDRSPPELFRLHRELSSADPKARQRAQELVAAFWNERIRRPLLRGADGGLRAGELVSQMRAFLRVTRPRGFDLANHAIDKTWTLVRRNLCFLLGLGTAVAAFAGVEQLRSLLLNNYRGYFALAVVALGGVTIEVLRYSPRWVLKAGAAIAPRPVGGRLAGLVERSSGWFARVTTKLRLGKRAYYQIASHAVPPERGLARWSPGGIMVDSIGRWEIVRAVVLGVYLFVAYRVGLRVVEEQSLATFETLYPIAALFLGGLLALHWVDLWDFLDPRPIRVLGVGLFLAFMVGSIVSDQSLLLAMSVSLVLLAIVVRQMSGGRLTLVRGLVGVLCLTIAGLAYSGIRSKERNVWRGRPGASGFQRITAAELPFGGDEGPPVVLVAASGGGSRAAVYTALTLDAIHEGRLPAGRDEQAFRDDRRALQEVGANIHAVSSVSGGSLAAAAYIAERIRRNEHAEAGRPDEGPWAVNEYVRQNFLTPTLEGALVPGKSRGEAIEEFWDSHVHLRGLRLSDLAERWRTARVDGGQPPFPLPLFNSCALDGHAVVISPIAFRAYSKDDYEKRQLRLKSLQAAYGLGSLHGLTWILDRDAIYGLDEWNDQVIPTVAQAVRASANFPFGFPLVDVETAHEYGVPFLKGTRRILLTDGGVLSNSGLWTLYHLMVTDEKVRERLRRRGVLLVLIDASKMPEYQPNRNDYSSLFGAIRDQAPIAQNLHRKMFELLLWEFGSSVEIVTVDLPPTVTDNVQTTWALDDRSLEQLDCNFSILWNGTTASADPGCNRFRGVTPPRREGHLAKARFGPTIVEAWKRLKTRANRGEPEPGAPQAADGPGVRPSEKKRRELSLLRIPLD